MILRASTRGRLSVGSPSWRNNSEKLAVEPPGIVGVAADRIIHMIKALIIHMTEIPISENSAVLRIAMK